MKYIRAVKIVGQSLCIDFFSEDHSLLLKEQVDEVDVNALLSPIILPSGNRTHHMSRPLWSDARRQSFLRSERLVSSLYRAGSTGSAAGRCT